MEDMERVRRTWLQKHIFTPFVVAASWGNLTLQRYFCYKCKRHSLVRVQTEEEIAKDTPLKQA
jgi:hypothetical protein